MLITSKCVLVIEQCIDYDGGEDGGSCWATLTIRHLTDGIGERPTQTSYLSSSSFSSTTYLLSFYRQYSHNEQANSTTDTPFCSLLYLVHCIYNQWKFHLTSFSLPLSIKKIVSSLFSCWPRKFIPPQRMFLNTFKQFNTNASDSLASMHLPILLLFSYHWYKLYYSVCFFFSLLLWEISR